MILADFSQTCYQQQSIYNNSEPKNITNPCLPRVASRRLVYHSSVFVEILNVDISYRPNLRREGDSKKQSTLVASLK